MFSAHRVAAGVLAGATGLLLSASALAQVPPPMLDIGQALRAGVVTVRAPDSQRLRLEAASSLLAHTLQARGYRPVMVGACHRTSARVVLCPIAVGLHESRWLGTGAVRLLRDGRARVRYSILGVN